MSQICGTESSSKHENLINYRHYSLGFSVCSSERTAEGHGKVFYVSGMPYPGTHETETQQNF